MQNIITRELAKVWCEMTPEQRFLTPIPEENFDVVKAYSEGAEIEVLSPEYTMQFSGPRQMYKIVQPKWEPKGGKYFVSNDREGVLRGVSIDPFREHGVEFETKEAAEKASKYYRFIHRLYKLAEELNEGWEPDWSNIRENRYHVYYCSYTEQYMYDELCTDNYLVPTFKSFYVARKAVEILNNEDKYWS